MTAQVREEELCSHHQELITNQTAIEVHLGWIRKAAGWTILLLVTCLGSMMGVGYSLSTIGHSLSLQAQANRDAIAKNSEEIKELKQNDKEICRRIDRLEWKPKGGGE